MIINDKKISFSENRVSLLIIATNSQFKFKKHKKITAGKYFSVSFESENKAFLTAEKIKILGIITTFIYIEDNNALLICRFDTKRKEMQKKFNAEPPSFNRLAKLAFKFQSFSQTGLMIELL